MTEPTELRKMMDLLTPDTLANICADLVRDESPGKEPAAELYDTAIAALCANVGVDVAAAMVQNRI